MCEHMIRGRCPKKLQLNSEGPCEFRDMLGRTVRGTVGGNAIMDLGRLLGACLRN